ncbi:hypothetical protein PSTG_11009 [Puccinia striiformis f. sp. tritici PST-78]|uniref:Uncharacterized protein n=1 Tax=Puccinia striiformis f. sp. tritici PST-78 TaxID=1165861 RepID=A0A0L0V9I6_9BASI|nr:hypothetical protein PSTG_11009 [Puccinia striiformis f. sp. tritici PST-78]
MSKDQPSSHPHRHSSGSINSDQPPKYSDQPSGSSSVFDPTPPSKTVEPSTPLSDDLEVGPSSSLSEEEDVQPPEFSVYQASYTSDSLGNITSHDSHLNTDGEALCRFILLHISTPPELIIKLSGTHEDLRIETTTEYINGRTEYRTREQRQTVTDFSFTISGTSETAGLEEGIRKLYIVGDGEVVGRGGHRRERGRWENGKDLGLLDQLRGLDESSDLPGRETTRVGFKERRRADLIVDETQKFGYPPFVPSWMFPRNAFSCEPMRPPDHLLGPNWQDKSNKYFNSMIKQGYYRHYHRHNRNRVSVARVERELRQWCDDYCAQNKYLKELRVQKSVFGWNLSILEQELLKLLNSTPHLSSTHFSIDFYTTSSQIIVRPVNMISKIFSLTGFVKFILTISLIYPILWLMRYVFLGAEYDVVRVAYPLVYWHESSIEPEDEGRQSSSDDHSSILVGQSELEWFSANQANISRACQNSKVGSLQAM